MEIDLDKIAKIFAVESDEHLAAMEQARDAQPEDDPAAQILASAVAFRRWALTHREEFQLVDAIVPARWQIKIPRAIERRASWIKFGILTTVIVYFLSTKDPLIYPYVEPFWMFTRMGTTAMWTGLALLTPEATSRTLLRAGAVCYGAWVAGTAVGVAGATLPMLEGMTFAVFPVLFVGLMALTAGSRSAAGRAMLAALLVVVLLAVWPALGGLAPVAAAVVVAGFAHLGVVPPANGERYDVELLTSLLLEDATWSMSPYELWLQTREDIRKRLPPDPASAAAAPAW